MNGQEKAQLPDELPESSLLKFSARPETRTTRYITEFLVVFIGCLVFSLLRSWLSINISQIPDPLRPLTGFVLACLLRYSVSAWFPALLGSVLGPFLLGDHFSLVIAEALNSVLAASVGWFCLVNCVRHEFRLITCRDLLLLMGCGGVPAAVVGATLYLSLRLTPEAGGFSLWLAVFLGVLASITAFTPAAYFLLRKDFGLPVQREKRWEPMALYLAMAVTAGVSVLVDSSPTVTGAIVHALPYFVLVLMSLRLGLRPTAIAISLGLLEMFVLFRLAGPDAMQDSGLLTIGLFPFLIFLAVISALLMGAQHDAIMASQIQTRLAMAAAEFCMWEWNIQSGLKFHSAAWTERIGLKHDQFQPLQHWIDTVHPHDNVAFATAISEGAKNKVPGFNVRFRSRDARTGKWFWSKSVALILKNDADQRPLQAVGMVMDINSDVEAEELRIASINNKAELENLRSQLNPHFLFNCLNSVRALVGKDTERAREMITSLSSLLRYLLKPRDGIFETIETEMSIVLKYLGIEQIRFGSHLQVEASVAPETRHYRVPSMIILTLVENAIKHGISRLEGGGLVKVEVLIENDQVVIRVSNDGQLDTSEKGIGLENTRRRLRILAGKSAQFQIYCSMPGVVTACLRLPYSDIKR